MIDLLIGLSTPASRAAAARSLAARLGVDEVLLFVRDPELGALLPAAGMAQTLRGGPSWWQFLKEDVVADGLHRREVEFPPGCWRGASACTGDRVTVVMLGADPAAADLAALQAALPWLAATLINEQRLQWAQVELRQARELSQRSAALSQALESARSEAAQLNVQLREEDRRKDQFLAMLAHELRNPLAGVVASLQVLRHGKLDSPTQHKTLALMERQSFQLQRLVDDLMDVARVNHGKIALDLQPLVLQDVLHGSVENNRHSMQARGHTLTLRIAEQQLVVKADAMRLTQVFSNLLHNAIKYTDSGGQISIDAQQMGDSVKVSVTDSGVGIDPTMLESVFKLFQQAPVALDRSLGGLGLGLTLVRKLLALHDGRVEAHSGGHGQGSTFMVWLPLHAGPPLARAPAPGAALDAHADPLHVLVIEDNADVAEALCELLSVYGHSAESASRGKAGLARIERGDIDLVLLDLGLPDIDGYEVVKQIRAAGHRTLPVVALTGYGGADVAQAAREAGFDDHRVKPLGDDALTEVLAMAAGVARRRRG